MKTDFVKVFDTSRKFNPPVRGNEIGCLFLIEKHKKI